MAVTTWNIVPDYDKWGKDSSWNCDDWVSWHKHLKDHFGKERANIIWNYAYAQGTQFASHWDCRTFNSNFRAYVKKEGLDPYASVGIPLLPQLLDVSGSLFDFTTGIANTISEIGNTMGGGKFVKIALYSALFLGIGYVGLRGYVFYKSKLGK